MKRNYWQISNGLAVFVFGFTSVVAQAQKKDVDVEIGRTASGQLAVSFDTNTVIELPPVEGKISGWLSDEPGFEALAMDEPDANLFTLGVGAQIQFEVVQFDPAFHVYTPGFAELLSSPGQTMDMGGHDLHTHANWFINSNDLQFDANQQNWHAQFRLRDLGTTGYTQSPVYYLSFAPVPEPFSALLLGGGALVQMVLKRRKRSPWRRKVTVADSYILDSVP